MLRQRISAEEREEAKVGAEGRGGGLEDVVNVERPHRRIVADDLCSKRADGIGVFLQKCRWDFTATNR